MAIEGIPIDNLTNLSPTPTNSVMHVRYAGKDYFITVQQLLNLVPSASADGVGYSNATSGLSATTVQDAIDELSAGISAPLQIVETGVFTTTASTTSTVVATTVSMQPSYRVFLTYRAVGSADEPFTDAFLSFSYIGSGNSFVCIHPSFTGSYEVQYSIIA